MAERGFDSEAATGTAAPLRLLVAGAPPRAASALRAAGCAVEARVVTGAAALAAALEGPCDCVLAGQRCGDLGAAELVRAVRAFDAWLPLIFVGASFDAREGVDLIRRGASDCLSVDDLDLLPAVVSREIGEAHRRREEPAGVDDALRVAEALATMTETLIASLHSPMLLQRACRTSAEVLGCDAAATLVIENSEVAAVASYGGTADEREAARVMRWPLAHLAEPLRLLERDEYCERRGARIQIDVEPPDHAAAVRLFTALRRGGQLIGIQVVTRYGKHRPYSDSDRRLAVEISRLISLALDDAQAVEELRRAGRIKSEFVRTVSHDLRIPLTTVIGYADLLAEEAFGALNDEQRPILRRIGERARGLLELITATLELPSLESGKIDVDLTTLDVSALIDEMRSEAKDWRLRRDLELTWDVAAGIGAIESDRTKVHVVVKNLVVNALKFTDCGAVRVTVKGRGDGVEFAIADTGIGISADRLEKVFDPFWQEDGSSTRRHGGVGLGLYIVRRLVELLGGRISVESAVGAGSTFRVWLPRRAPQAE